MNKEMVSSTPSPSPLRKSGFSILELLISLLLAAEILVAAGLVFDLHDRAARIQTQLTDMQQSLRVAQYDIARLLRMAGRGQLNTPFQVDPGPPPRLIGGAIEVRNNVQEADDSNQVALGRDQPRAVPGTDILTVRGCMNTSLYQIDPANDFSYNSGTGVATVTLRSVSPVGIPQCLRPLAEQLQAYGGPGLTGSFLFGSVQDRSLYYVAQLQNATVTSGDPMDCSPGAGLAQMQLELTTNPTPLSPGTFDPQMGVALVCQLEEWRYYVRQVEGFVGPVGLPLAQPRLAKARMIPGTEDPFGRDEQNLQLDIADGIFDLQVALGFDSDYPSSDPSTPGAFGDDNDNTGIDDQVFEGAVYANRTTDDWLYNHHEDDPTAIQWRQHRFPGNVSTPDLLYVRFTLAARTPRPDVRFVAGDVDGRDGDGEDRLEDNDYNQAPAQVWKQGTNANYRRRVITTLVDLRNVG